MLADVPSEIFATEALALRRAGFAVLPAHGKEPTRKGFTKWKHAPGPRAVAEWAEEDPTANIVYVPGLCRTERGGDPIVVVDADDAETSGRIEEIFGRTPGKVKTRRGKHALYRDGGSALGNLSSLKKFGLNADLKHGRSIVVAPPSLHDSGTVHYAWEDCDPSVIRDLPMFNVQALQGLIDSRSPSRELQESQSPGRESRPYVTGTAPAPGMAAGRLREDSRGLGLNDMLCKHAWAVDGYDELLDLARTINQDYPVPLDDDEVVKRSKAVWKDRTEGKLQRWLGREATAQATKFEVKDLSAQGKNGGDALMLLMLFRAEHSARVRRGETFEINPKAMAKCQSLHWSPGRIRAARNVLLEAGYIKVVAQARNCRTGRMATQYTLVID